jgi:hypothetical protein
MLENLDYNRILARLPVGLIGFMLTMELEDGFYADPPKNKFKLYALPEDNVSDAQCDNMLRNAGKPAVST